MLGTDRLNVGQTDGRTGERNTKKCILCMLVLYMYFVQVVSYKLSIIVIKHRCINRHKLFNSLHISQYKQVWRYVIVYSRISTVRVSYWTIYFRFSIIYLRVWYVHILLIIWVWCIFSPIFIVSTSRDACCINHPFIFLPHDRLYRYLQSLSRKMRRKIRNQCLLPH